MVLSRFWRKLLEWFAPAQAANLNFTPRARQLVALARREAKQRHYDRVEPMHVWLALLRMEKSAGCDALRRLGVNPLGLIPAMDALVVPGRMVVEAKPLDYSIGVKQTLALAIREAKALNHRYVGTDHVLLGLMRLAGKPVAALLARNSIGIEKVRAGIRTPRAGDPPA